MSNPTSTPQTPDDPAERSDQPIDPTRTVDAYFDKQAPTTPGPAVHENDETTETTTDTENSVSPTRHLEQDEPASADYGTDDPQATATDRPTDTDLDDEYPERTDPETRYPQSSYPGPDENQTDYPAPVFTKTTTTLPAYTPPTSETITPEGYSTPIPTTGYPPASPAPATGYNPGYPPGYTPDYDPAADETTETRVVRMRTVVFGLVLLVIAGAVLVGQLTDVTVNAGAVLLALMIGGGLLLIAGARRS